jgi:hypothetical protein
VRNSLTWNDNWHRALSVFEVLSVCPTGVAEEEYGSLLSVNPVPVGFEVTASEIGDW